MIIPRAPELLPLLFNEPHLKEIMDEKEKGLKGVES
jgi:hypothetical protein